MPEVIDPIKRLIERRHSDHKRYADEWKFLREAAEGGPDYAKNNLFKHPKEDAKVFLERQKRAADHHFNITDQVLDIYEGFLFQQEPELAENLPECVTDFHSEADQDGSSALHLARRIARLIANLGSVWVCVDKPKELALQETEVRSAQQEKELGLKPYAYVVLPTHVLDGKIERGVIKWLLIQEDERDDADPFLSSGESRTRYRLWFPDRAILIIPRKPVDGIQAGFDVQEFPHEFGEVPFVLVRFDGANDGFYCPGLVADIAHLDRAVFNKCSLIDEIHYAVTFPQMVVPYSGELYTESGLTGEGKQIMRVGLDSVIPYHADNGAPGFISPPSEPAEVLETSKSAMIRLAFSLALLDSEVSIESDDSRVAASGVSKAYTFEKLNKRLAAFADVLEGAFRKIFALVCKWAGISDEDLPDVPWEWPDTFEVRSVAQELEELAAALGMNPPSATLKAELWKRMVSKLLPKCEDDTRDTINDEIEAGTVQEDLGSFQDYNVTDDSESFVFDAANNAEQDNSDTNFDKTQQQQQTPAQGKQPIPKQLRRFAKKK